MNSADVDRWLQAYIDAWKTYDRDQIGALFAEDVEYRYHPYDDAIKGREAVVASWLGDGDNADASTRDPEGTYDATYRAIAVNGDVAIATGRSIYTTEPGGDVDKIFHNCFVMRFDDQGRCREFTEWFMEERP
jgi:ketosteroid isomerase-like protein